MGARPDRVEPTLDGSAGYVVEHELAPLERAVPFRRWSAARNDEEPIALAPAELAPRAGTVEQQHVREVRFGALERRREVLRGEIAAGERGDAPEALERARQLGGETRGRARSGRHDCEHRRPRLGKREAAARLQLASELPGNRERKAAVELEEWDEGLRVEHEQPAVAHRAHGRRPLRAGQQAELAQRGAGPDLAQQPSVACRDDL